MKKNSILAIVLVALLVAACSSSAPTAEPVQSDMPAMAEATATKANEPAAATEPTSADTSMDTSTEAAVSFSQDVWPIFEQFAVQAHGGKGGVFLESYDDIMNYVVPGDPENSMIYKVITGNGAQRMPPPPEAPLSDEMIQTIYDWIAQGALNN
jgi:hypothetical protein